MANPNLKDVTHLYIGTEVQVPTTSFADLHAAVGSGLVRTVEAIFCTNIHASTTAKVTIVHRKSGVDYEVAKERTIAVRSTINAILGKPLYLNEGDSVKVKVALNSTLSVVSPYTEMDEL